MTDQTAKKRENKVLRRNEQADGKPVTLAKQLIEFEEDNVERLKQYLG